MWCPSMSHVKHLCKTISCQKIKTSISLKENREGGGKKGGREKQGGWREGGRKEGGKRRKET